MHLIAIRSSGHLVAIAPLFIESLKRIGIIHVRSVAFIGSDTTDYLDLVVAKWFESDCVGILASHIAFQSLLFDVVHLVNMPDRTLNHALLYEALSRQGFGGDQLVNEFCPRTELQNTLEATLAALPSSKRSSLKRVQRKIESDFKVELQVVTDANRLPLDFSEFISLHQQRWNESEHLGVFADARAAAFHHEFAELSIKRNWLFLAFLLLMYPGGRGLTTFKFNSVLLVDSLKRRVRRERFLWSQVSKEQKTFSGATVAFVVNRIRTNVEDGFHKLRSPEKSTTNRE